MLYMRLLTQLKKTNSSNAVISIPKYFNVIQ